jgi:putative phosphoesterase
MKIGIVGDTHGFFDPRLAELLAGAEAILHTGDVGAPEVLDELRRIAPVQAVRGNLDPVELDLPVSRRLQFGSVGVELCHQLPVPQAELEAWSDGELLGKMQPERRDAFLETFDEGTRVVVFGHSHQPCLVTLGHRLFLNPGSAGKQRFSLPRACGLLEVFPRGIRGSILALEEHNDRLPGKVWLPAGE